MTREQRASLLQAAFYLPLFIGWFAFVCWFCFEYCWPMRLLEWTGLGGWMVNSGIPPQLVGFQVVMASLSSLFVMLALPVILIWRGIKSNGHDKTPPATKPSAMTGTTASASD